MAITLADFTKIWASTSPLTPYTFSDPNYAEGWNFIGSTPPSRQMWDFLQKNNDEKLKYIVDNFLPLDGGTMTGAIVLADGGNPLSTAGGTMDAPIGFDAQGQVGYRGTTHTTPYDICKQMVVTAGTVDSVWDDGNAKLCLHTYDDTGTNTAEDGGFALQTSDGNGNAPFLEGKPNGNLKWNGKEVERVNASGTNYIRYESGVQICWGEETKSVSLTQVNSTGIYYENVTITLPVSFKDTNYVVSASSRFSTGHMLASGSSPGNTGSFNLGVYDFYARNGNMNIWWHAIGWWK